MEQNLDKQKKILKIINLLKSNGLIRATVNIRDKKSFLNNKIYETMYLIHNKKGKRKTIYVPRDREEEVKGWVKNFRQIEKLLDEISDLYIKKIIKRKK